MRPVLAAREDAPDAPSARRRPRGLWWALGLAWAAWTVFLGVLYTGLPGSPDQSLYDYMGWVLASGGVPYVDVADQNWPGKMVLHAIATALFGNHLWSWRLFDYGLLLATCALLWGLARRTQGRAAAWAVVPLYQTMYVLGTGWFAGQRDVVAAPMLLMAVWAFLGRVEGGPRRLCVFQGLAMTGAILLRPTLGLLAPLLALVDGVTLRRTGRRLPTWLADHAAVAATMGAALAALALAAVPSGALAAWRDVSLRFVTEVYAGSVGLGELALDTTRYVLGSWHWYLVLAGIGVVRWWRRTPLAAAALGAVAVTTVVSLVVQRKGFGYHLGPLLPLLALGMAPLVGASLRALVRRRAGDPHPALAALVLAVVVAGFASKLERLYGPELAWRSGRMPHSAFLADHPAGDGVSVADAVAAADHLREVVPPGETVLVWGTPVLVNYLAERRSPLRFASMALLSQPERDFSLYPAWREEIRRALAEHPPAAVLLVRKRAGTGHLYLETRGGGMGSVFAPLVEAALQRAYGPSQPIGRFDVFLRRVPPVPSPGAP